MKPTLRAASGHLPNYWYAACQSDELSGALSRTVLGTKLVLWRDDKGEPQALLDRCLHRNALLSEGTVLNDGAIGCPYHGWTYGGDGQCRHVPSMGPGTRAPATLKQRSFPAQEASGLVWVWMGDQSSEGTAPFAMPHWDEPGWGAYYMKTRFNNGVTQLVENFMDVPHTVFVHRGWFRSPARKRVQCTVERSEHHVCVTYHADDDAIGDRSGITGRMLNPKNLPLTHTDQFFLPNTTRVDYIWGDHDRAFVITSTCTPVSDDDTWVYTLISFKLGGILDPARHVLKRLLPWYTRRVIDQDVDIMAVQQASFDAHGGQTFNETEADRPHEHIEALRAWAEAGGDAPPLAAVTEEIEMWI